MRGNGRRGGALAALVLGAAVTVTGATPAALSRDAGTGLPGRIDGIEIESHDHLPPMIDSRGNLYRVTEDYKRKGNEPRFMKSSNRGASWREQDAGRRGGLSDLEGGWALQDGTSIWFAWETSYVALTRFRTSDHPSHPDTYAMAPETVDTLPDGYGDHQYASLAKNPDGTLWIAYGVDSGGQRIAFKKRTGPGRYSARRILDTRRATTAPRLVSGSRGVTHIFYKDDDNHRIYWRTLTTGGTLSAARRVDTGGTSSVATPLTNAVHYRRDGDDVLMVAFANPAGVLKSVTIRNGRIGPEQTIGAGRVMIDPEVVTNLAAVAHLAVDGATVHAMWSDARNGHLYRDRHVDGGRWGRDRRTVDTGPGTATQAQYVYCNVLRLPNGRTILGFTYDLGPHADDAGHIHYDRVRLAP